MILSEDKNEINVRLEKIPNGIIIQCKIDVLFSVDNIDTLALRQYVNQQVNKLIETLEVE